MKRIVTAAVLIPLVLLAVFRAPLWLFLLMTALVALAAAMEYLGLVAGYGLEPFRLLTYFYMAALFLTYWYAKGDGGPMLAGIVLLLLFIPFLLLTAAMARPELKTALPACEIVFDRDSALPNRRSR